MTVLDISTMMCLKDITTTGPSNVGTMFHIVIYMLTETGRINTVTKTVTEQFSRHTY